MVPFLLTKCVLPCREFDVMPPLLGVSFSQTVHFVVIMWALRRFNSAMDSIPPSPIDWWIFPIFNKCCLSLLNHRFQFHSDPRFITYMSFYRFPRSKGSTSQAKFLREQLKLRGTWGGIVNLSCNPGSKLSPIACAVLSSMNFLYRIMRWMFKSWAH